MGIQTLVIQIDISLEETHKIRRKWLQHLKKIWDKLN